VLKDNEKVGAVMVVGSGIAGIQASLDLANSGMKVYLVENGISIGGVMAQLERLERLSTSDGLTGVANRRCFDQTLQREWTRLQRTKDHLSLIMCDVDFFKLYNDAYGHQGGDDCLKSVAQALQDNARRGGDCVARYGGEEFAVIMPATEEKNAVYVADKIRQAVEKMAMAHSKSSVAPHVTLSLGVATVVPDDPETPESLIKRADEALYRAKSSGRNRVVLWEPLQDVQPKD